MARLSLGYADAMDTGWSRRTRVSERILIWIRIRKSDDAVARLFGLLRRPGQAALSLDEIDDAIREEAEARAVRRNERSLK